MKTGALTLTIVELWQKIHGLNTCSLPPDKCPTVQPPEGGVAQNEINRIRKSLRIVRNREKETNVAHCLNPPAGLQILTCVPLQVEEGAKPNEFMIYTVIVRLFRLNPHFVPRATAYSLCSYPPDRGKPEYHVILYEKRPSFFPFLFGK